MSQTGVALLMSTLVGCVSARQTDEPAVAEPVAPASAEAAEEDKGTVLVVLSSVDQLQLRDGQTYTTGFYFPELMTPLQMLMEAGYEVEFANPAGNEPVVDIRSDNASYFGDVDGASDEARAAARAEYAELRELCTELGVCGEEGELRGTQPAHVLADVVENITSGEAEYVGVLVPGGHAPMQDLIVDPAYGALLRHYAGSTPIGLICHAPVSLIAAMPDPESFITAFESDDVAAMDAQRADWPFADAELAVFTTAEEQVAEGRQLGGEVRFYPDALLEAAGATVTRGPEWQSNSVVSGLLVTGQNPGSHTEFGQALLELLEAQ